MAKKSLETPLKNPKRPPNPPPDSETETEPEIETEPEPEIETEPELEPEDRRVVDFWDEIEGISEELEAAGITALSEVKFLIYRKHPFTGQMKYCKTVFSKFPDLNQVGTELGGGDYQVIVYTPTGPKGKLQYDRLLRFSIDTVDYPVKKTPSEVSELPPSGSSTDPALLELIRQGQQQHADLMLALKNQENGKSKVGELTEIIGLVKVLMPTPAPASDVDPSKVIDQLGTMLKTGMDMAFQMQERKDDKSLPEVFMGMLERALERIDIGSALGAAVMPKPQQIQSPAAGGAVPTPAPAAPKGNDLLVILNEFFAEIIMGYDNTMSPHPYFFAEKIRKFPRLAPVLKWCLNMAPDNIIATLKSVKEGPLAVKMADPDFVDYVKEILDCVKDYDIITGVDDESGEVIKKPKEVKNDNPGSTGNTASGPVTNTGNGSDNHIDGNNDAGDDTE